MKTLTFDTCIWGDLEKDEELLELVLEAVNNGIIRIVPNMIEKYECEQIQDEERGRPENP